MRPLKKTTVQWERNFDNSSDLVFRIPNIKYPKIDYIGHILVQEHQKAVFYKGGSIQSVQSAGKHQLPKETSEIALVDISPRQEPFGIPKSHGPITKDDFQVGLSGMITLRVNGDIEKNVAQFLSRVVVGNKTFKREQLVEWLREGPLVSVLRDIAKGLNYKEFVLMDREELINYQVRPRLYNELYRYGLDLISIDLTSFTEPQKIPGEP